MRNIHTPEAFYSVQDEPESPETTIDDPRVLFAFPAP